jgi:hypothetical protein
LTHNSADYFAEIEQAAFNFRLVPPVPGIGPPPTRCCKAACSTSAKGFVTIRASPMKPYAMAVVAVFVALSGCGGQSTTPTYPASAAPASVVIVDTDFAKTQLSVQDGDRVIAMMNGQHYAMVPIRPGAHNFSAGTGFQSQGGGTVGVDVEPGQTVYLQVGGISTGIGAPSVPGFATGSGRAEGAFGQGGISLIPQANAEHLMKQSTKQQPLPAS